MAHSLEPLLASHQTRTIAAQASEGDLSHFLVGSVGNHGDNEVPAAIEEDCKCDPGS